MNGGRVTDKEGDNSRARETKSEESAGNPSWADRWYRYLSGKGFDPNRGKSLSRRLEVESFDVQFGRIHAEVVESQRAACQVEIDVLPLRDDEWSAVLDALAGEALYAAQLLAGESESVSFLSALDSVFEDANVALLTASPDAGDLRSRCSVCGNQSSPCKHALVVLYRFGQMIADNPWVLLLLRGRDRQQVLTELRLRRSAEVEESAREEGATTDPASDAAIAGYEALQALSETAIDRGEEPALSEQIDSFWGGRQLGPGGTRQDLQALHFHISPPLIRLALLRRLGPPPFQQDSPEIHDNLAQIYFDVSAKALELAFAPEPDSEGSENSESER